MADKNVSKAVESKKKTDKGEKMTAKKLITIIIIVVLAMLMVGGIYYVIVMVSQSKAEKQSVWGSYNGEDIRLENNSVFYNTLVNDSNLQSAYLSGDYNTMMSSYYNAYQSQVIFTALSQDAAKAGIRAPQQLVNTLILSAGIYNGDDGTFSEEKLNASSEAEKITINNYYTNYYPYSVVVDDLQSTLVSEQEKDFVVQMAKDTRTFDYFVIDYKAYPNELAAAYGKENKILFTKLGISILSSSTEDGINAAYNALLSGTSWEDAVSTYSEDSYASQAGKISDELYLFSIATNMNDVSDLEKLAAIAEGQYSEPFAGPNGYTIYKIDSAATAPDFSDSDVLTAVKYYISTNGIADVTSYIETALALAPNTAKTDFEGAAASANATVISVSAVNDNIGKSQYLGGLDYYDSMGYLATAAETEAVSRELFTGEEGYVTGAIAVPGEENTYVVAKVTGIDKNNENLSMATSLLYNYYALSHVSYDRFYNVLNSDKHVDNFYTQFFTTLFSSST